VFGTSSRTTGPLFRSISRYGHMQGGRLSGTDVARVVKKLAGRAGMLRSMPGTVCGPATAISGAIRTPPSGRSCADRASVGSDCTVVHSGRQSVPGEQRGKLGFYTLTDGQDQKHEMASFRPRGSPNTGAFVGTTDRWIGSTTCEYAVNHTPAPR
jgi:hypothetical protein